MKGPSSSKQIRQGMINQSESLNHFFKFLSIKLEDMENQSKDISQIVVASYPDNMSFPWQNQTHTNQRNTVHNPSFTRTFGTRNPDFPLSWNNRPRRTHFPRPQLGKTEVYGAIIRCTTTNRYCLVEGIRTGKWSFPKGHRNTISTDPLIMEDPFACVIREVGEEIGVDNLPMPIRECPIRVGYYYLFEVNYELELQPRDRDEIGTAGWFTIEEMKTLNLNIDANVYRSQLSRS